MADVMGANTTTSLQQQQPSTDRDVNNSSTQPPTFRRMTKSRYHMENVIRFRQCSLEDPFQRPYTVRRLGQPSGKCWNPSDKCIKCTAVVRFRANWPISILSYGFFGPYDGPGGKYQMEIEVLTEDFLSIAKTEKVTPHINPNEEFHVKFDYPVPILPCTWYYAKFTMMGPPTHESKSCYCKNPMRIIQCGDDKVEFTFDEPETNQLPEITFALTY